ncbi:hypothetical protein GH714_017999 [Hevea brasiliensis]|uniref:Uncharacterized protein n=1 Tax=Hevea brasiliensis TaxID=3981 RepID=A0A6A6L3E5_HEVBR|nr:hypothetical protein GH714_017999 [Hevea brasiliensis]
MYPPSNGQPEPIHVSGIPNTLPPQSYAPQPYASYIQAGMITCFCPCITFGQIAEILNKGSSSCAGSGAVYGLLLGFTGLLACTRASIAQN